mmetsp:Transcript_550/g.827  ORF Transcript_550/g.827 Transcript_550/m.827 type:complete len:90 (-) Transcript_550:291-560(-)
MSTQQAGIFCNMNRKGCRTLVKVPVCNLFYASIKSSVKCKASASAEDNDKTIFFFLNDLGNLELGEGNEVRMSSDRSSEFESRRETSMH